MLIRDARIEWNNERGEDKRAKTVLRGKLKGKRVLTEWGKRENVNWTMREISNKRLKRD